MIKLAITMRLVALTLICLSLPLFAETELPPAAAIKVDFDTNVKPILARNCYSCHGPKVQQSGLRLDKRQNALRGGDYGPVILSGRSAESKLIRRVVNGDGGLQMPPTGKLAVEDIGILRAWIDQGADFGVTEVKEEAPKPPVDPKLKALIGAVRSQDLKAVAKLLKASPELVKATDQGGATALHHAAGFGTLEIMQLLIDKGADVNAKNERASTPLHWAVASETRTRLLLERGADVNARQTDGRTPLYNVISMENHDAVVRLLLEHGADPNLPTANGNTPLMVAAGRGDVEALRLLIDKKAKVDFKNGAGATALINAALSRNTDAVKLLLDRGADVNVTTKRKLTALSNAAMQGSEDMVKLLLDHGAQVNVQDDRGYSPLMYAAYAETMPAGIVQVLLAKGADASLSGEGETARTLALKRGDTEVARLLGVSEADRKRGGVALAPSVEAQRSIPAAVTQALQVLEKQSPTFVRTSGCISCHNQMLPSAAAAVARDRGIPAPAKIASLSREMREVSPERAMDLTLNAVNSLGYEMFDLGLNRTAPDEYTDSIVRYVLVMQTSDGNWKTTGNRPPLTSDDFQTTAFALYTLKTYAPAAMRAEAAHSLARAAKWLESATPVTTQERAFHLLGLAWSGASAAAVDRAAAQLAATQRPDGGWNQLPGMGSDAYATGEALYALQTAGRMPASNAVYRKGTGYLLRTQAADGSWHVKTRSLTVQPYFESGFPYGEDQWISAAGTAWASMALSLAVEPDRLSARRD